MYLYKYLCYFYKLLLHCKDKNEICDVIPEKVRRYIILDDNRNLDVAVLTVNLVKQIFTQFHRVEHITSVEVFLVNSLRTENIYHNRSELLNS